MAENIRFDQLGLCDHLQNELERLRLTTVDKILSGTNKLKILQDNERMEIFDSISRHYIVETSLDEMVRNVELSVPIPFNIPAIDAFVLANGSTPVSRTKKVVSLTGKDHICINRFVKSFFKRPSLSSENRILVCDPIGTILRTLTESQKNFCTFMDVHSFNEFNDAVQHCISSNGTHFMISIFNRIDLLLETAPKECALRIHRHIADLAHHWNCFMLFIEGDTHNTIKDMADIRLELANDSFTLYFQSEGRVYERNGFEW
ncbi:hypothetical protein PCE1_000308 [Barthelona sp. PCE]